MINARITEREKKILELYCEQEAVGQTDMVRGAIKALENQLRDKARRELEAWDQVEGEQK